MNSSPTMKYKNSEIQKYKYTKNTERYNRVRDVQNNHITNTKPNEQNAKNTLYLLALGFMTLPRDPRLISSDITVPSLRGSMGGLVTYQAPPAATVHCRGWQGGGASVGERRVSFEIQINGRQIDDSELIHFHGRALMTHERKHVFILETSCVAEAGGGGFT